MEGSLYFPPTTADEHMLFRGSHGKNNLASPFLMIYSGWQFHIVWMIKDIWNQSKLRFGGNANLRREKVYVEGKNFQGLRYFNLKTKGGIELLSFDDLYYKLKTLEVDIKGYSTFSSSQYACPSHSAFVSTTSASKKMSYADSPSYTLSTYIVPSISKTGSHRSGNVIEDVLQSFVADTEPEQQLAYEDFDKIEKLDLEGDGLKRKWLCLFLFNKKKSDVTSVFKEATYARECGQREEMTSRDNHSFKNSGDWKNGVIIASKEFCMIAVWILRIKLKRIAPHGVPSEVQAYKNSLKTLEKQKRVYQQNQLGYEEKIRVLSIELENTTNLLKHSERINVEAEIAKKDLQTKLDNHLAKTKKWTSSSKNLLRLIDSSMSVRTKVGLGFNDYIGENELGWDDSAFSVFTTNSEEVEGRPLFSRFAKADSMKVVPPPLSGDYTPLSDHIDLDESQMSYGTKSSTSGDSNSMSNDFVSCDNSDKSSEVNINDFASSDSSVISSEPKSKDSTSYASTSSVSTSESEAEIESNVGTPIQEPIIVQDLPSFSCNSSDKNENTSRTSCNKNGYFNKKASHFRKNNSSASKSCFVCGSYLHLIKDCNYYETQYANDFDGVGYPQREPIWDNATRVTQSNQFVPQAVLLRSGKVSIPAARPNQVPAGRPKPVSTGRPKPVSTGKQNRPPPVHAGRRNSSSVTSGWWQSTARPMTHLPTPTSSYFQTSTPFGPHVYYNQMHYDGDGWATAVKPSADSSGDELLNFVKKVFNLLDLLIKIFYD
ncbi:hypothetical protein Tco_0965956 [Tanacetum coccineum]